MNSNDVAAFMLVRSCSDGLAHGHCIQPYAVDPATLASWPRTTASLLLAWTEARFNAEVKRQGLVQV